MDLEHGAHEATTTAKVMQSIEAILFEIGRVDRLLADTPRPKLNHALVRVVRRRVHSLSNEAESLMILLSEVRLETIAN